MITMMMFKTVFNSMKMFILIMTKSNNANDNERRIVNFIISILIPIIY